MTRRELLAAAAATPLIAQQSTSPEDWAKAARDAAKANAEAMAKVVLPMSTEPAFLFKA